MIDENVVLFSGYAKLPGGTVAGEVYKVLALVVLLDIRNGKIVEADSTLSTRLAERFIISMLVGRNIHTDLEDLVERINTTYHGSAKKAIINALRIIDAKYMAFVQHGAK